MGTRAATADHECHGDESPEENEASDCPTCDGACRHMTGDDGGDVLSRRGSRVGSGYGRRREEDNWR